MRFGDGDGTGGRRGNLTREGAAARGPEGNPLDDAAQSRQSRKATSTDDPTLYAQHRLVSETGNNGKSREQADANDNRGLKDGSDDGSGLGWVGTGKGKGLGIDNVDWGGGGNRTVLKKEMPKFPTGTLNTEVKLKFRVRPDGTVSWVMPVRRGGNPQVDQAAMSALYRWRFNPLSTNVEMEGTITFVFRNS